MTRAIIEGYIDSNHIRVRIPRINKLATSVNGTPTEELSIATICAMPGYNPSFITGDIVFVEFEEDDVSKPVIVGDLKNQLHDKKVAGDLNLKSAVISVNAQLPEDTTIGSITRDELAYLKGLKQNIQFEFDKNAEEHNKLNESISEFQALSEQVHTDIESLRVRNNDQDTKISKNASDIAELKDTFSGPLILNNISYGTSAPSTISNPEEGQIYIYIQ